MAAIIQISPCVREYVAVFYDHDPKPGEASVFYIDVPQFCLVQNGKETTAAPMIISSNGDLVPVWSLDDYIGCCPIDEKDDDYWLKKWQEDNEPKPRVKDKGKRTARRKPEPEPEPESTDDEEEEEEEDEEAEGEVHLGGRKR